jgi:hypothetical protein
MERKAGAYPLYLAEPSLLVSPKMSADGWRPVGDGRVALPAYVSSLRLISERPWRPGLDPEKRHLGSVVGSLGRVARCGTVTPSWTRRGP